VRKERGFFMNFHKQRMIIGGAAALGVISAFLPWVTFSFGPLSTSFSGINSDMDWTLLGGLLTLLLFAGAIVCVVMGNRNEMVQPPFTFAAAGAGGGAAFIGILQFMTKSEIFSAGSAGIGLILTILMGGAVAAACFVNLPFYDSSNGGGDGQPPQNPPMG
jgi:peptidoglycan/LPS O-acetylase OafA/YrhL